VRRNRLESSGEMRNIDGAFLRQSTVCTKSIEIERNINIYLIYFLVESSKRISRA